MSLCELVANKRTYKEYKVLSNTPLGRLVHLLVLRAKDFLELIPIGRHVEVKMNVMGKQNLDNYLLNKHLIYIIFTRLHILMEIFKLYLL